MASSVTEHRPEIRFPRYGLRTLMAIVAVAAVLFAVMGTIGPLASAGLLMGLAVIGLHVVGNAIGTSLRDCAPRRTMEIPGTEPAERGATLIYADMPVSQLRRRTPLGWINRATTL